MLSQTFEHAWGFLRELFPDTFPGTDIALTQYWAECEGRRGQLNKVKHAWELLLKAGGSKVGRGCLPAGVGCVL